MYYTIYKITNTLNGKFYIGKHQTKKLDDSYMGSGKLIKPAIKKYGIENFKKEILYIFETGDDMNEAEKNLVILSENSYNLCPGGKGGFGYINTTGIIKFKGKKHSAESRPKMGHPGNKTFLGKNHNLDTKEKIGLNSKLKLTGKKRSNETKLKISKTLEDKSGLNISLLIEIMEYANKNNLSIRKTCSMFNINRVTYTKYYKRYAGELAQGACSSLPS